jgi:hypothetical protein
MKQIILCERQVIYSLRAISEDALDGINILCCEFCESYYAVTTLFDINLMPSQEWDLRIAEFRSAIIAEHGSGHLTDSFSHDGVLTRKSWHGRRWWSGWVR